MAVVSSNNKNKTNNNSKKSKTNNNSKKKKTNVVKQNTSMNDLIDKSKTEDNHDNNLTLNDLTNESDKVEVTEVIVKAETEHNQDETLTNEAIKEDIILNESDTAISSNEEETILNTEITNNLSNESKEKFDIIEDKLVIQDNIKNEEIDVIDNVETFLDEDNTEVKLESQKDFDESDLETSDSQNVDNYEEIVKESILDNNNQINNKNKHNKKYLIVIFLLLILLVYLFIPKIYLKGDKNKEINYNEEYIEDGYKAKFLFKDITDKIIVNSNLDNKHIGKYQIVYHLKYGFIKIKRIRKIIVVDKIAPVINTEDDLIKVCPNKDTPDISYTAIDEYDGDITSKVISSYKDNKILLLVNDSSNNLTEKIIDVKKIDDEAPKITLKGNNTMYINIGVKYTEPGYIAIDNCDGDLSDKVEVSGNVLTKAGSYKVSYMVTDSSGNKSEVVRTVIVRSSNLYNSGSISSGTIYLTFDDGPNEGTTNIILDVLKEEGIKATFFVTCNGPDYLIKRIYDEGHTIALHTATHNYAYVYSSVDNYFNDLNRVSTRVKNITGYDAKIIRFPGGSSNTVSRNYHVGIMTTLTGMVLDKGYRYFDWNVDAMDASSARSSSDVYNNVTNNLSKSRSNVVLMHDTKTITRDALRNIIRYGKINGYNFEKIEMDTYMIRHGVNN